MRLVLFYHSLVSDWNHGNAHFLRGIVSELLERGHEVEVYEPENGWSLRNLRQDHGETAIADFFEAYPRLASRHYSLESLDLDRALAGADVVIVHEWNEHELVARVGEHRRRSDYALLFHDTHHRSVTSRHEMARYDLRYFDGVLAFGAVIRDLYLSQGWAKRAWVLHEAADTRVFHPRRVAEAEREGELVWIGNWGDGERSDELRELVIDPVVKLGLRATFYGVRYPEAAKKLLADAGIRYGGWLANFRAPELFAKHLMTVHVPRRPYVRALRGIPTIRVFEALACGIPLVSAPWDDSEGLFSSGEDFLVARDGREMERHLRALCADAGLREALAGHGLATIRRRHTCAHRVDELLAICRELVGTKA